MLLLDTHVCLWFVAAPERIGPATREAIQRASRVSYSSITLAEIAIKRMLGRLDVPADLGAVFDSAGLVHLPFTGDHAGALELFPDLARLDPFDRMLLAQAAVEGHRLVTADARLLAAGGRHVLDERG